MIPSKIVRTGEMLLKVTETTVTLFKQGNLAKLSPLVGPLLKLLER